LHNCIIRANWAAAVSINKSVAEVEGQSTYDFYPEEAEKYYQDDLEVIASGRAKLGIIELYRTASGEKRWIKTDKVPYRDAQGKVIGVLVFAQDITEQKRADEALHESEERYRALYEDNPSMYFTLDAIGTILSVNRFGVEQLGYHVEELVGQSVLQIFHEEDRASVQRHLATCIEHPSVKGSWEFRKVRKDGTVMWVRETARAVRDPDGRLMVLVVCEDITERKRTEEVLRAEREYSSLIINATSAIVCGITPDGTTTFVNPAGERITGYRAEELLGRNWWRTFYPGDEYRQVERLFRNFTRGDVRDYEMVLRTRSGEKRTISWNSFNRLDADGTIVEIIGFGNDVTARKHAP
jgi:PAS domain S-box-containing protein